LDFDLPDFDLDFEPDRERDFSFALPLFFDLLEEELLEAFFLAFFFLELSDKPNTRTVMNLN
jgi:hypothetical protein